MHCDKPGMIILQNVAYLHEQTILNVLHHDSHKAVFIHNVLIALLMY